MDVIPLLLPLFVIPGASALSPVDAGLYPGALVLSDGAGKGREAQDGDLVTIHFRLRQDGGKELADTVRRGLPFSFVLDSSRVLVDAVRGMRPGESRLVFLRSEALTTPDDPMVPKNSDLVMDLRLIRSRALASATPRVSP